MRWLKSRFGDQIMAPRQGAASVSGLPLQVLESSGLELRQLWRYIFVVMLITGCLMLSTWFRVDRVEIAVALDGAELARSAAKGERARLTLELATLENPAWLGAAAIDMGLDVAVTMVDVPTGATN